MTAPQLDRRTALGGLGAMLVASRARAGAVDASAAPLDQPGAVLAPWRPGGLDIHHIATGRGNSELIIGPDGTSTMIDAGAMYAPPPLDLPLRPGPQRRPGEWIARYAARRLRDTSAAGLDYLAATHLHPDHVGDVDPSLPRAADGDYRLTGISDVAAQLPIGVVLDRGAPDYADVDIRTAPFARNYLAFVAARRAGGGRVERLRAGAPGQMGLVRNAAAHGAFDVRTLAVNGEVWTGQGDGSRSVVPPRAAIRPEDLPDENVYSAAFRFRYGAFVYATTGDLTSNTLDGDCPWRDVETPAARVCGPADVAVAAHHGLFDASGADVVRALRPRIWLIDAWHVSHPSITTLERLFSQRLYAGPRDVLATGLAPENGLVNARLTSRMASSRGHVVVRVAPGGASYRVVVTDNADEADRVLKVFGPFRSSGRPA